MCSAQYGCFLQFLDFMFSWYVAHVFSKCLWNSPSRPYCYWYHLWFYFHMRCISIVRSLYFRIFSGSFLITFLSPEFATSTNINVPFITDYNVWVLLLLLSLLLKRRRVCSLCCGLQIRWSCCRIHDNITCGLPKIMSRQSLVRLK